MAPSSQWEKNLRACLRHRCRTRLLVNRVIFWESGLRPTVFVFGRSKLTFQHETIRHLTRLARIVVICQPFCVAQDIDEEVEQFPHSTLAWLPKLFRVLFLDRIPLLR